MTLFDRKVDLAKFSPDTPLYVMCREWMSNNPECTHATPPSQLCPLTPHTLPLPTPLPMDKEGREVRIDIPKPHPPISKSQEEMDNLIREVQLWCVRIGNFKVGISPTLSSGVSPIWGWVCVYHTSRRSAAF